MNGVSDVIVINGCNQTDEMHTALRTIHNESVFTGAAKPMIGKYEQIEAI